MWLAHLKWFETDAAQSVQSLTAQEWWFVIFFVAAGLLALYTIDYYTVGLNARIGKKLAGLRDYVPTVLAATIGLTLLLHSVSGFIFAPNIDATRFFVFRLVEFVLGGMLVLGVKIRLAAAALIVLFVASLSFVAPLSLLEHLEYLGAAIFLIVMPSGRWTLDRWLGAGQTAIKKYQSLALTILQFTTGASLAVLAFSEKLSNLALADSFLQTHSWNILAIFGASNHQFIIFAGACELIFGMALMLNFAPRLVILLLGGLMALTAAVLGPTEVVGHLFAIGVALAIWVYARPNRFLPKT